MSLLVGNAAASDVSIMFQSLYLHFIYAAGDYYSYSPSY